MKSVALTVVVTLLVWPVDPQTSRTTIQESGGSQNQSDQGSGRVVDALSSCRHAVSNASGAPWIIEQSAARCDELRSQTPTGSDDFQSSGGDCWDALFRAIAELRTANRLYDQAKHTPSPEQQRVAAEARQHHQAANDAIAQATSCIGNLIQLLASKSRNRHGREHPASPVPATPARTSTPEEHPWWALPAEAAPSNTLPEAINCTTANSMNRSAIQRPALPLAQRLPGYQVYPLDPRRPLNILRVDSMAGLRAECNKYDAVANGTFMTFGRRASAILPTDEKFQDVPDAGNKSVVGDRGGVAVLDDGTVLLGQQHGNGLDKIQARFGCQRRTVVSFLGGGALIVSRGLKVASNGTRDDKPAVRPEDREEDLSTAQHFHRSAGYGSGINAQQFHAAQHTVLAVADGQAFLIITPVVTGVELQRDLVNAGVQTAVKFDGGGGFFFCKKAGTPHGPGNVTGFGAFIRTTPK